ncbi:MAG: hypothetical protein WAM24_06010 [Ignavibacteriaceae bacterium]
MNNFPEELLKYLDDSKKHLSLKAISQFVNSNNDLNENEIKFFEEHLSECKICKENLYRIFDEEISEGKTTYQVDVNLSTKNHINFTDAEKNIEGILSKEDELYYLTFINLPHYLMRQNLRLKFPGNDLVVRIVSSELNRKYKVITGGEINFRNEFEVLLDVRIRKNKNSGFSKKKYRFLYIFAAAVLIGATIYLLIAKPEQPKETSSTEIEKPDTEMLFDSVPVQTDTVQKQDITKPEEQEKQSAEKINPQSLVKIPPQFKNNSYLERLVDKYKDNGIIINPAIGDTLKKQINFKWSPLEADEYDMIIVNNKNEEIWGKTLADPRVTVYQKLDPGIYYWKITVKGKLQSVGKFYVE